MLTFRAMRRYGRRAMWLIGLVALVLATIPFHLASTKTVQASDVSLDPDFAASAGVSRLGNVQQLAVLGNGKIVVSGQFNLVNGSKQDHLARLNADGTLDTSFAASVDQPPDLILAASNDKIVIGGDFTSVNGTSRTHLAQLNADGSLDNSFSPSFNGAIQTIALQSDGKILVSGNFTTVNGVVRSGLARLNSDGTLDTSFNPAPDSSVTSMAVQSDGKILIGGGFKNIAGSNQAYLARLNSDGTLDSSFTASVPARVNHLALQSNGAIVITGMFKTFTPPVSSTSPSSGVPGLADTFPDALARLNSNGTLDSTFTPNLVVPASMLAVQADGKVLLVPSPGTVTRLHTDGTSDSSFVPGLTASPGQFAARINAIVVQNDQSVLIGGAFAGAKGNDVTGLVRFRSDANLDTAFQPNFLLSGSIRALAIQSDGKVLIGGSFDRVGTVARSNLARLEADGTVDSTFDPDVGLTVYALAIQSDGKILVGGSQHSASIFPNYIQRLNSDGSGDTTFQGTMRLGSGSGPVYALVVQSNDKILVGGAFSKINETDRPGLAQLNPDGSLDSRFRPRIVDSRSARPEIYTIRVQSDQKILIGGAFDKVDGTDRNNLARLNEDSSLDSDFAVGANGPVNAIDLQSDGKVVVGGEFSEVQEVERNNLARLNADGTIDPAFAPEVDGPVAVVHVDSQSQIILGGDFASVNGMPRTNLAYLTPDADLAEANAAINGPVRALAVQSDGSLIIGGIFDQVADTSRLGLARLFAANQPPTAISLVGQNVAENQSIGTLVGTFSTSDPDGDNNHTYSLVAGAGSADNAAFSIAGNQLRTNAVFDYEAKNSYTIRVRTTDGGGATFEQSFTITIVDVNENVNTQAMIYLPLVVR